MIVEVINAAFGYGNHEQIFSDISFGINGGEIFSIVGPNGSGKSTLLKCLNGILSLQTGDIRLEGQSISKVNRRKIGTSIGYVPQNDEATFPFTAFEMVLMGRAAHLNIFSAPKEKDKTIAQEAMQTVGIEDLAPRIYNNLSGGETQMVNIARALASQAKVLILDEPTSHLDIKNQVNVMHALYRLARERGMAIIMTTHCPNHALLFSDNILMLRKGAHAICGLTETVMTETNILEVFGVNVKIIPVWETEPPVKTVVPRWEEIIH